MVMFLGWLKLKVVGLADCKARGTGLDRQCRVLEKKQAVFAGMAAGSPVGFRDPALVQDSALNH